jgi:transcriptional regulator with XRE-family HTH domain
MEKIIGKTIQARLKALNQKQVWLAEQAGVSRMAVSDWIRTGKISVDKAVKVASALRITLDELLNNNDALIPLLAEEKRHLVYVDDNELEMLTRLREAPDNLRMMGQMILDRFLAAGQKVG